MSSNARQILFIVVLFLGLMLVSAGVGAMAAGESLIGMIFLICGILLLAFDISILVLVRRKNRETVQEDSVGPETDIEQEKTPEQE